MPPRRLLPPWSDLKWPGRLALILLPTGLVLGVVLGMWSLLMADPAGRLDPAPIDGDRAYGYLKQVCDLGPRPAGSEANARQRKLVADHFANHGAQVREQPFHARDPSTGEPLQMVNLIGSWFPERNERVVLGAHYDTRPFPDQEEDFQRQKLPFLGANDGGSGVALLMELAHHLSKSPTRWGVDLVLFDGEERVYGRSPDMSAYFLGSGHFARTYAADRKARRIKYHYVAGLVLDMVGGKDAEIKREPYSLKVAPWLVSDVWAVAKGLDARMFTAERGVEVSDDHLPLNRAEIPTIDIIDFEYPHWHRASDLPEHCSPATLAEVGRVVSAWLAQSKPRGRRR